MQEPHHVAQKLTSKVLPVGFARRAFKSAADAMSSFTGCDSILRSASRRDACFSFHFVEQPKTPVCFTATSRCASRASMASRASWVLTNSVR